MPEVQVEPVQAVPWVQHGLPDRPQLTHWPITQFAKPPVAQVPPAQQGVPGSPHVEQVVSVPQISIGIAHAAPWATQVGPPFADRSQHAPPVHIVAVVSQHDWPTAPQAPDEASCSESLVMNPTIPPPSAGVVSHDDDALPDKDSVWDPEVHEILQLDPLPDEVQETPSVDSVPHRQMVSPSMAAVQHSCEPEEEHPTGEKAVKQANVKTVSK